MIYYCTLVEIWDITKIKPNNKKIVPEFCNNTVFLGKFEYWNIANTAKLTLYVRE